jgi:hypothetical protein
MEKRQEISGGLCHPEIYPPGVATRRDVVEGTQEFDPKRKGNDGILS